MWSQVIRRREQCRRGAFILAPALFLVWSSRIDVALGFVQSAVNKYVVNDGTNNTHEPALGEFQVDLGGNIPFTRYGDTTPTSGHYYALKWNPGTFATFLAAVRKHFLDIRSLDADIKSQAP